MASATSVSKKSLLTKKECFPDTLIGFVNSMTFTIYFLPNIKQKHSFLNTYAAFLVINLRVKQASQEVTRCRWRNPILPPASSLCTEPPALR